MKKQSDATTGTLLLQVSSLLVLIFLAIQVIPRAVGQRNAPKAGSKSSAPSGVCPALSQEVAAMPLDLYGAAGASDGTFSYHAGGYSFSSGNTLAVFNRYDPVTNTWTPLSEMPQAAIMASAVYYPTTNKIYVFGGEDALFGTNYNITRIYDIASNTWTTGANMPDMRSFMASGYSPANGKIYLVSGYNTGTPDSAQPDTWEYDPVADTFTSKTDFPHPAGGFASGVINGKLYVAGGRDAADQIINLNWEYDPVADTWTQKADEPASDQNNVPGSGVALDMLWVFGGGDPFIGAGATKTAFRSTNAFASSKAAFPGPSVKGVKGQRLPATDSHTRFYDPSTDTWGTFSTMNELRAFTSGAAINTKLIAAGGYNAITTVASAETVDAYIPTPTRQYDSGIIQNGGFETGHFPPWVISGRMPVVTNVRAHSGTFSGFAGGYPSKGDFCGGEDFRVDGVSWFYQEFTVPASGGILSFWHWDCTANCGGGGYQDAYITDTNGTILQTIFHQCLNGQTWINTTVNMAPFAGQTVRIKFQVHEALHFLTGMWVDDVRLLVLSGHNGSRSMNR